MLSRRLLPGLLAVLLSLTGFNVHAQDVLISEFMASNHRTLLDEDNSYPDWIELYNPSTSVVNLDGWYLTDSILNKTKWKFPAVSLGAKQFLVVFASDKNRTDPAAPLHTNFKLSADGEYLGLIHNDGVTIASEYAPTFPPQQEDVSYGMVFNGGTTAVVAAGAPAKAIVPQNDDLGTSWTTATFNDASWQSGATAVGYEASSGYESLIGLNLYSGMYNGNTSAYIRIPFTLANPGSVNRLTLRMKYDDGFVAWINGVRVASAGAPDTLAYNSAATADHPDAQALQFVDFDVSSAIPSLGASNVLAVQGLNTSPTSSDFLILPELDASSGTGVDSSTLRYFASPTPGAPNGSAGVDQGPIISQVVHSPDRPAVGQNLLVTARITPQAAPIASVSLTYRVNFGTPVTVGMFDDGLNGDGSAGDGVYGATIPSSAYGAGQMVRYYVTATDSASNSGRYPLHAVASASPEYLGTVVIDPNANSQLPVLWWYVENPSGAETDTGTASSIYYNGVFYDNVWTKLRGQTSASWPKKHFNFDMNAGYNLVYDPAKPSVTEFNLQSTYSDKSYMRSILAWGTYADAGVPGCVNFPVRVQQNGAFYSVASFLEQPNEDLLNRNGLDPDGALYKMYSDASNIDGVEKKTRKAEDNSDLVSFIAGLPYSGSALTTFLFDNLNVPEAINYWAATTIMHDNDHVGKNYFLYRDTDGSGQWSILPWDKDLTFGRNFTLAGGVINDTMWANVDPYSHPLFGDQQHPKCDGPWNRVIDAMSREPSIRAMYLRRLRTLMDNLLQPPGTPAASLKYEARIDALRALMSSDVTLDRAKWGNPYGANQDLNAAVSVLKNQYLAPRRTHLFVTHTSTSGIIPASQAAVPPIAFGGQEASPASGNQDEEYLILGNPGSQAADISAWTLSGAVTFTFAPGTVIPAHGKLYVSPKVATFRNRAVSPKGGEGLLVVGNYHGHLESKADNVILQTAIGSVVAQSAYSMADVATALSVAAGISASGQASLALYDSVPDSAIDVRDVVKLVRVVAGLDN